ncbi:hypothetical protein DYB31_009638 [Aphanomyces astaci]|uniref:Dynein heavy chain linker domain-containing protein n=1 Tax=Aphanomyces astaci TaxID=112090 RepID=A0A397EEK3_APHAT|nr:hypothetical protein DYB31_009638 [Aphanomyces astaci]
MDDDTSSSKSIRMNARKEVTRHEAASATAAEFASSSRWIDAEEYERVATIMAREKDDEYRKSQPTLQLYKPKTKPWHPPVKVPLHKRKQPDLAVPEDTMDSRRTANKDLYAALVDRFRHSAKGSMRNSVKTIVCDITNVHTIEDAILYFLCEKHRRNILYFQPEKHRPEETIYRPYDLTHIAPLTQNNKEEHYVMGATNLVHYKANENVECIPVSEWVYHSHMFDHLLKGIPLFQQLLRRRMFSNWNLNVQMRLYCETRLRLGRRLHCARPNFMLALRVIHNVSSTIRKICALDVTAAASAKAIPLAEWTHLQEVRYAYLMSCGGLMGIVCDSIGAIESQLNDAKATVHGALHTLVQSIRDDRSPDLLLDQLDNTDMYKMRQAYPEWKSIPMAALKQFKVDNQTQVAQAKRDLMLLPSLFRLLQYLFTESVYFMVLASIHHLHMQFSAADGCAITVAVSFLEKDANGMTLEPSEQDMLHHSMEALSRLVALSNSYSSEYRLVEYLTPPEVADAVPDGKFVNGMRLVDLLKSDDGFHAKVRSIRTAIKVAFTKVATHVKSFETLRPIYSAIQNPSDELPTMDKVDQYMENVPILLKTIQTKIRRLDTWQHQCHKTQASWSIGFLEVHCRHIISELLERINTQRSMAHQLLTDLTTQGILQCVTALKDAVTIMDERPQTTEAFCEQRRCIRTLSENEKLLLQEIRMVEDAYKALRSNCPAAASDCVGQFNLIHALQAKYNLSFQANVKFSKKMLPVIGQQVAQALQKFTAQCKRILNALETNVTGIKVTPIVLLESARCLWLEVHDVWTLCQQWRMSHAMMHAHKFTMQSWTSGDLSLQTFCLKQLNDLDMWSHSDKIRTITYHARIDSETEAKLQVMKARWAATELVCQGLQLDPVVVDDLLAALDNDLMQVQCLMQLTSQPLLYQALATWSNEINYIQDTLELWVAAQHDWVKLDRIFQLPDIQQSVRHANVEFQVLSRKWKAMMKGVRTNTLIQHCVREVTNRTFLGDAKALFERLWKQLVLFLHEKRREFPRFNFVSDRELLAIMAGTTLSLSQPCHDNAGALSVVVSKCFEHVCRISVETIQHIVKPQPASPQSKPTTLPSPTKPTASSTRQHPHTMGSPEESSFGDAPTYSIEVFAVHGQHDETISLNNSVKITQRPEGWMKELAKVLRRAMKENLRHLMAEYSDLLQYYLHDKSHKRVHCGVAATKHD